MNDVTFRPLFSLLALVSLAACGGGDAPSVNADSSADGSSGSVAHGDHTAGADTLEVTLAAPPYEGTHRESGPLNCMVYNGLWQASWEEPERTGLSGMILQLKDVPASGGSSDKVTFSAVFGSQANPDELTAIIDVIGAEHGRDGRGTVTREGDRAVIRIEGSAQHGGAVTAVLSCASVDVM